VRNGLANHWRESYVRERIKSMKAGELAGAWKDWWRYIAITLIDPGTGVLRVIGYFAHDPS
jgi:hypothetical protein